MGEKQKQSFIEIHRRKQIIEVAIEMISAIGYQQTTLTKIAQQAGISKGVIFYYFKNKEDLVKQTGAVLLEELRAHTINRMQQSGKEKTRLSNYVAAYFDFIKKNRKKFQILMEVGLNQAPSNQQSIFGAIEYKECRDRLSRILKKDRDGVSKEMHNLPAVIQGMLDGVGIQWVADTNAIDLDACQTTILNMIDVYLNRDQIIS